MTKWTDPAPLVLAPRPDAAGEARRHVADVLRSQQPDLLAAALLLTSELVTNALVHGAPPVTLRIFWLDGVIRIEVADGGLATARQRDVTAWPTDTEGGRGLLLVAALATDWGWLPHEHTADGKTAWFELHVA